jgi:hypothetical protein
MMGAHVHSGQDTQEGIAKTLPALQESESSAEAEVWKTRAGITTMSFDLDAVTDAGLRLGEPDAGTVARPDARALQLVIKPGSSLTFSVVGGSLEEIQGGRILHLGDVRLIAPQGEFVLADPSIVVPHDDALGADWVVKSSAREGGLVLRRMKGSFDRLSRTLTIRSAELRISPGLAEAMGDPKLAEAILGGVTIRAAADWAGGAKPAGRPEEPAGGGQGGERGLEGCDMAFCQLYGFYMPSGSREGDVVGLSVATTSWGVGTADCIWLNIPDEEHPFIVMNMYRLKDDRFEQIGMSHIKHGFYALGSHQCGGPPCTFEPGHGPGDWLGQNCTDTYGAGLNAVQSGMGPKYGVNPWTGYWYYPGSHMQGGHSHDNVQHRLQVHDADLDSAQNPGATYYGEGFYVMLDDVNVMNSASWKPVTVSGTPGGHWSFGMSGSGTFANVGFAIDAWTGATQTMIAEELPVKEFQSPDGRSVLAAKATDLGGGMWHYEYALLNIDMDRQVGSFSVPIAPGMTVTNVGFHAVEHHGEPFNTADPDAVPINNAPWVPSISSNAVTWSTATNPLRWSMLYNFRFDANAPPDDATVTLGLFRTGSTSALNAQSVGPVVICADVTGDGIVNVLDLIELLLCFGQPATPPCDVTDVNGDGTVNVLDLIALLLLFGQACP